MTYLLKFKNISRKLSKRQVGENSSNLVTLLASLIEYVRAYFPWQAALSIFLEGVFSKHVFSFFFNNTSLVPLYVFYLSICLLFVRSLFLYHSLSPPSLCCTRRHTLFMYRYVCTYIGNVSYKAYFCFHFHTLSLSPISLLHT
jgi:hypothetical protein